MDVKKEVFAVFEICHGSYDNMYKLSCIYSTVEKALEAIKEATLRNLSSSLKFYIKELETSMSDPKDDYSFCFSYKKLIALQRNESDQHKLNDVVRSYVWMPCRLDEVITFEIDKDKYIEERIELSKEQRDEIDSVLQNEVYRGRFEQIQQKKFEEQQYPNPRKFKTLRM